MQLYALDDNEPILAQEALRHKNYLCPECLNLLRVRGGLHKRSHFYHLKANRLCRQHKKSLAHIALQMDLSEKLGACVEKSFPEIGRIADVYWEKENIVFEIQCSPISLEEAKGREDDYKRLKIRVVWILHTRQFNKKNLSAAEFFLRTSSNCYFAYNSNAIFDQFEILQKGRRLFWGVSLKVDLGYPKPIPTLKREMPDIIKNRINKYLLYFSGDLVSHFLKGADFSHILALEKKFSLPFKSSSFSLKKIYEIFFNILLENRAQEIRTNFLKLFLYRQGYMLQPVV